MGETVSGMECGGEKTITPPCVFKKLLTLGPLVSHSHFLDIHRPFSRKPGEKSIKIFSA